MHVVLVHPQIPWNTGNVGRTCLAAGARLHLVRPLGFGVGERRVRRAGLDYWEHVAPVVHDSFDAFERALPELGEPLLFSREGLHTLYEVSLPARPVFLFGSEDAGLPADVRERYRDRLVRVPVREGPVRSLNLSTVVGIVLYEALRRRM